MTLERFPAKFGKYILLDRLNAGGMAEVFVAKASGIEGFERMVAIKCMLPALVSDSQFTAMFVDEARLAAQVAHANVVQIYELGRQAERLYIAMELVHGRDLRHIVRTAQMHNTPLPPAFVAYVISKAAEGLDYAHRRLTNDGKPLGLVHRDVSPQNILVSYDGEVKVVDFGIAKAANEVRATQTQVGVLKGKFAYMAPEQVMGEAIDRRADIFALGSVLFEALSGQRLFQGDNDLVVLERVRDAVLPNMRALLTPQSERMMPVLTKALSLLPDMRYEFASNMAEALEPMLIENESIFGSKRAASVMHGLYKAEIEHNTALLRSYSDVNEQNCVIDYSSGSGAPQDPVVYESTFMGPTPHPAPAPERLPPRARSKEPQVISGEQADSVGLPNTQTSTGVRRPVTLTRRNTKPAGPAKKNEAHLDVLPAHVSAYEPLANAGSPKIDTSTERVMLPSLSPVGKALNVERVRGRLRMMFMAVVLLMAGMAYLANLSMDEPLTLGQSIEAVRAIHPIDRAQAAGRAVAAWRPLETWLFGHDVREEPTALAKHLAKQRAGQPEPSNGVAAMGFLTVRMAGNAQALIKIDDGPAQWAPLKAQPISVGTHVVHAERHRAGGQKEVAEQTVAITEAHGATEPLEVTLRF